MHHFLPLVVLLLAGFLSAADQATIVALWASGNGTIDGVKARTGQTIQSGQMLNAAVDRPLRLTLHHAPSSTIIIGAGSTVRLLAESQIRSAGHDLVLEVHAGVVQVDLASRGPWRELRVQGGAMEVHVLGTLFMFERVKRDQDYLAMVRGKVRVNLLAAITRALGKDPGVELDGRHGLGASASGFSSIDSLSSRPQIIAASSTRQDLQSQGQTGAGGWDQDTASAQTSAPQNAEPSGQATTLSADPLTTAVQTDLNQAVVEGVVQQTTQQVVDSVSTEQNSLPILPGPPPAP